MRHAVRPLARWGLLAVLGSAACTQSDSVANVLLVARVDVSPPTASLNPQETLQLEATPRTSGGLVLPAREVTWSSSAPALAEVSPTGLVRAVGVGGPVSIRARVDGVDGEASINVMPAPVHHVTVTPPGPLGLSVGGAAQLSATAYDAAGTILTGRTFLWDSDTPGIAPVTTGGMVLAQNPGGPVTITASTGGKSGSTTVSVALRPATRLGFLQQPGLAIAGQPLTPALRVAIQDDLLGTVTTAGNAVTLALGGGPSGAIMSGTTTVAAVGGIASFTDLSIDRAGTGYTLVATASGLTPSTSTAFDVTAGAANRLGFVTAPPAAAQSGMVLTPASVLQLRDGAGNPVPLAGVLVTASLASGPGALGGTPTALTNAGGAATFPGLSLTGSTGTYSIAFSALGVLPATSGPIVLSAGVAAALTLEIQPSATAQSGAALARQPEVQVRDAWGNAVTQAGIVVTASIASGPGGTLTGGTVVATGAKGVAPYASLGLSGPAGSYQLRFSSQGLGSVTSTAIALGAGSAATLDIAVQPSASVINGVVFPQQPVIQLRDAAGNPVSLSGVPVTVSIQTGGGTLGGTALVATGAGGAAHFSNLSLSGPAGIRTLLFSAPGYPDVTSTDVSVTAGSPAQLAITTQPSATVPSGTVFPVQPVLQVQDALNNPVGGVVVTATIASGGGALGGTASATSDAAGIARFSGLSIGGLTGLRTLSFSAAGTAAVTSAAISVTTGPASRLVITTQPPASVPSGVIFPQQPVLLVTDAWNNPVGGVVVTALIASGGGTLGGTTTAPSSASGVAAFGDLSITGTPGDRTLSFDAPAISAVTSTTIALTASAAKLSISTQPSTSAQSGIPFARQPVILVRDAANNPVGGVIVTASIATGGGTLGGTVTAVSTAGGTASFTDLSISGTIGGRTLSFSAPGAPSQTSGNINVTAGPASQLIISTQPSGSALSGVVFGRQPAVRLADADGNLVNQSGFVVTVALGSGSGSGTLSGTLSITTNSNGVATFTNLKITGPGSYTLLFSSGALAPVVSAVILVL